MPRLTMLPGKMRLIFLMYPWLPIFANFPNIYIIAGCRLCSPRVVRENTIFTVRRQILTKLGLTEPPTEGKSVNVSEDILQTYRSAVEEKEKLNTAANSCFAQAEADGDLAKTVAKLPLTYEYAKTILLNSDEFRDKDAYFLRFNTSTIFSESLRVSLAELRLYQMPNYEEPWTEVRINVCENTESTILIDKVLDSGCRSPEDSKLSWSNQKSWISLDVTSTVRKWVNNPDSNKGLVVTVTGPTSEKTHDVSPIYLGGPSSDGGKERKDLSPNILVWYVPRERAETARSRNRRSLDWQYCTKRPKEPRCCLRSVYIDFERDLRWTWIHAPKGFYANYCAGKCPLMWGSEKSNHHTSIMALYNRINPDAPGEPCCVPKAYEPLVILYFKDGHPKIEELPNMAVKECTCL